MRALHERVALVALGALAAHGLVLLGDGFLHPGLGGIVVPFAMSYRPVWSGIGISAATSPPGCRSPTTPAAGWAPAAGGPPIASSRSRGRWPSFTSSAPGRTPAACGCRSRSR
jgi:hypothetical protein